MVYLTFLSQKITFQGKIFQFKRTLVKKRKSRVKAIISNFIVPLKAGADDGCYCFGSRAAPVFHSLLLILLNYSLYICGGKERNQAADENVNRLTRCHAYIILFCTNWIVERNSNDEFNNNFTIYDILMPFIFVLYVVFIFDNIKTYNEDNKNKEKSLWHSIDLHRKHYTLL